MGSSHKRALYSVRLLCSYFTSCLIPCCYSCVTMDDGTYETVKNVTNRVTTSSVVHKRSESGSSPRLPPRVPSTSASTTGQEKSATPSLPPRVPSTSAHSTDQPKISVQSAEVMDMNSQGDPFEDGACIFITCVPVMLAGCYVCLYVCAY